MAIPGRAPEFYVLALSQNRAALHACTAAEMWPVELPRGAPRSLAESQKYLQLGKRYQQHSTSPAAPAFVSHGQGGGREDEKLRIGEYLKQVADAVGLVLRNRRQPLVLAAVAYEAAMFRRVNRYSRLVPRSIAGSPDFLPAKELHDRALAIIRQGRHALKDTRAAFGKRADSRARRRPRTVALSGA